jgi:uncharacterized membrane protein YebE (DUF533 family)
MHEEDLSIIKALAPVAWADGVYTNREREMIEALLDAYSASDDDKELILAYAAEKKSIDDIELQELSADDRRVVLQHAVLLSFVDGALASEEAAFLVELGKRLKISDAETQTIIEAGSERAKRFLNLL